MTYASRSQLAALVALSLAACQPEASIGANDDADVRGDAPVADAPVADAPVADAPVADAPVADAPVADAPPPDRTDVCERPPSTPDCASEQIAQTICAMSAVCHVCVQVVDAAGVPDRWAAVNSPASCGCFAPYVIPADGGVAHDAPDGGAAGCASSADCASGQVCEFALGCGHARGECHADGCQSLPVAPQYCGCDGRTIQQASACLPARPYGAMGACPDGGVPSDA